MPFYRLFLSSIALLLCAGFTPLRADTPIFYTGGDSAINGYDTVAYFTDGEPIEGRADIAVMWKGVVWQFNSQAHREAFEANPRAYAPQFGGYCAYGVALGYWDRTEPEAWQIVNGKLYLIRSPHVQRLWMQDTIGHIAQANANWPAVLRD